MNLYFRSIADLVGGFRAKFALLARRVNRISDRLVLALVCIISVSGSNQAQETSPRKMLPDPLAVQVFSRADCPLSIYVRKTDQPNGKHTVITYSLENLGTQVIRSYVVTDNGRQWTMATPIFFPPGHIIRGQKRGEFPIGHEPNPTLSVDFILFEDGTIWGKDAFEAREYTYGFHNGRLDASSKVSAGLKDKNDPDLFKLLSEESQATDPGGKGRSDNHAWQRGYSTGYRSFFAQLLSFSEGLGRDGVEAELARMAAQLWKQMLN